MAGFEIVKALAEHTNVSGTRSTVLQSLQWLIGMLLAGLIGAGASHAPQWLYIVLACFLGLTVLLFAVAYIFFMLKNPDALRSERYTLSKMAIEKGLVGDDLKGLFKMTETEEPAALPSPREIFDAIVDADAAPTTSPEEAEPPTKGQRGGGP